MPMTYFTYLLQWSSYQKERIKDVQCHALLQIIGKKGEQSTMVYSERITRKNTGMRVDGFFNHPMSCMGNSLVNFRLLAVQSFIMEGVGTTIQDWKLYRQFQKTLESLNDNEPEVAVQNSELLERKFNDILEIEIEDEGEQLGGKDNHLELEQFSKTFLTKNYFDEWREQADLAASQRRKADFYYRFNVLEQRFKQWKTYTRQEKQKKERQKWLNAIAFREMQLLR